MGKLEASELDQLVAQIGDEILRRLKIVNPPVVCSQCASTSAPVPVTWPAGPFDRTIAAMIDHTILRADASQADIVQVCEEARRYSFASVCINPFWVGLVAAQLAGSTVKVCTVVGFPLGASATEVKRMETESAIRCGAREIDMVINIGALKSKNEETVRLDIRSVVDAARRGGAITKVIIEAALLDDREKVLACMLAKRAGAEFVKTSTGFGPSGATVDDVALMRNTVGSEMGVKASGGIRTLEDVRKMVAAGANRIGASASVKIVESSAG